MGILRKKTAAETPKKQPERRRHEDAETFRVGRTIAGDAQNHREDRMARATDRRKRAIGNIGLVTGVLLVIILIIIVIANYISNVIAEREASLAPTPVLDPVTAILDENVGENVSQRVKDFVAHLEDDVKEYGLRLDHVVLPFQMAREVDVYVEGRTEYYKMSLDRSSAVQAEDMHRMIEYLKSQEIQPSYVDLRIEGKAYYK